MSIARASCRLAKVIKLAETIKIAKRRELRSQDNSFPGSIAAVYCEYSYAEPSVPGRYTFLVPFSPFVYNVVFLRFQATKLSSEAMIIWNFQPKSVIRTFWGSAKIRGSVEVWRQNGWTIRPEKKTELEIQQEMRPLLSGPHFLFCISYLSVKGEAI